MLHRDEPGPQADLLEFQGMGTCKVAVQLRCSVFSRNRATTPPATPIKAFQAASAVVARWLAGTPLRMPARERCEHFAG